MIEEFIDQVLTFGRRSLLVALFAVIAMTSAAFVYAVYLFLMWVIYFIKATLGV